MANSSLEESRKSVDGITSIIRRYDINHRFQCCHCASLCRNCHLSSGVDGRATTTNLFFGTRKSSFCSHSIYKESATNLLNLFLISAVVGFIPKSNHSRV